MMNLTESTKYGIAKDKLDGLIDWITLGQEYGTVMWYTVIVVYVEVNIPYVDSVVWVFI